MSKQDQPLEEIIQLDWIEEREPMSTRPQSTHNLIGLVALCTMLIMLCCIATAQLRSDQLPNPIAPPRSATAAVRIELVGDSTLSRTFGYGDGFCANLTADAECVNMAKGGTSSKTYREQGVWAAAVASKPDYMIIQFGHNDVPTPGHMARETTLAEYAANMKQYVTEARAAGIVPVLVTPLSRRFFGPDGKIHSDLEGHAAAVREIAAALHVPLIDLHAESVAYLNSLGPDAQRIVSGRVRKTPQGEVVPDKTHLNTVGGYTFGRMVAVGLARAVPALNKDIKPQAAAVPNDVPQPIPAAAK